MALPLASPNRNQPVSSVTGDGGQYFRVRPSNSSVLEGGEVVIPCEVGNRAGAVQWVKDGFAYVIGEREYHLETHCVALRHALSAIVLPERS